MKRNSKILAARRNLKSRDIVESTQIFK